MPIASAITGTTSRSDKPPQPPSCQSTLSAQASAAAGSGRRRSSACMRARESRVACASFRCNPPFRICRTLLPNCISFMAFSGRRPSQRYAAGFKRGSQSMRRPGAVRLYAALGAAHDLGGLGDIQLLPVTHDESLALTRRQAADLLLNDFKNLRSFEKTRGGLLEMRSAGGLQGFERIVVLVLAASRAERRQQRGPQRAHFLAAEPVADRVLHDAMEQQRQLGGGAVAVFFGEPEHRILHDVERRFLVAHGEYGLLERSPLDALEERRKLAAGCQGQPPPSVRCYLAADVTIMVFQRFLPN